MRAVRQRGGLPSALLVVLALATAAGATSPDASAAVYWSEETSIGAANLDGSEPVFGYPDSIVGTLGRRAHICGLAVHAGNLYWGDSSSGAIGRMELRNGPDGTGRVDTIHESVAIDQSMIGGLVSPCGVAVDGTHLYWADRGRMAIGRANLDDGGVQPNFVIGAAEPCGVAVDAGHLYWANRFGDSIGRADLDGGKVEQSFIAGAEGPCGVAVDAGHVYWANQFGDSIGRASLDGGKVEQSFVPNVEYPCGVAVNETHVYWSAAFTTNRVGRANLDGTDVNPDLIPNPYAVSCGVALDARTFKPPPPPPSAPFFLGKVRRVRGSVAVYQTAKVPDTGGELAVKSKGLSWRLLTDDPPVREGGYLLKQIKLWPGKAGRAARGIRAQLARTGHADVLLEVTYEEAGKRPYLAVRSLTLVRPRPHRPS